MTMNATAVTTSAVQLFHSLADPARLAIVGLLADGERRVVDLTRDLGLAQSTVSGHLACLGTAGLVKARPSGRSTYYQLARPELWALLSAAETVLDATGSTVELCPEHHRPEAATPCGAAVRGCLAHGTHPDGHSDGRVHDAHLAGPVHPGAAHERRH